MINKRFIYSCLAIICCSVVAIMLKYPAKEFTYIVGIITGVYTVGQSYTDSKKLGGNNGDPSDNKR